MKIKTVLRIAGGTLFFGALFLLLLVQNPRVDQLALALLVGFGCVLALSGTYFLIGELLGKIDDLEHRVFYLEEELKKQKREKTE